MTRHNGRDLVNGMPCTDVGNSEGDGAGQEGWFRGLGGETGFEVKKPPWPKMGLTHKHSLMYNLGMRSKTGSNDAFRAIADPTRRAVLDLVSEGERKVNDLVGRFRMTQPAMSQHLRVLRRAGLVTDRRVGRERIYRIRPDQLKPVADWVSQYERFWKRKLRALGDFLENER